MPSKTLGVILLRICPSFYLYVYICGYVINVFLPHYTENTMRACHLPITESPIPNVLNSIQQLLNKYFFK